LPDWIDAFKADYLTHNERRSAPENGERRKRAKMEKSSGEFDDHSLAGRR